MRRTKRSVGRHWLWLYTFSLGACSAGPDAGAPTSGPSPATAQDAVDEQSAPDADGSEGVMAAGPAEGDSNSTGGSSSAEPEESTPPDMNTTAPEANPIPEVNPDGMPISAECREGVANDVFDRYVAPLVSGGQPSSCNQCHLSGVSLGNFVRSTPCESMGCLLGSGEVDLAAPSSSKILERILRADPSSGLITAEVIQAEYDGMLAWIEYSSLCHTEVCGEQANACGGESANTGATTGPLGECAEETLIAQFEKSVYSTVQGRCAGCHDPNGPRFEPTATSWLDNTPGGAARTMYNIIGRRLIAPLVPETSLLLAKPLSEEAGGVQHTGGPKYEDKTDATYVATLQWIEAYAKCKADGELGSFDDVPVISIVTPREGMSYENPVRLDGLVIDAQQGAISDPVRWSSDVDGELGRSPTVAEAYLSAGTHTLTFAGRDEQGNEVELSVRISVK